MGDSNDRLRLARLNAGLPSARQAALRFGWNPSTYASHENGQTSVPPGMAPAYAKAFKVSPGWILTGEGEGLGIDAMLKGAPPAIIDEVREFAQFRLRKLGK